MRELVSVVRFRQADAARIDPAILESCAEYLRVALDRRTREFEEDLLLDAGMIEPTPRQLEARAEEARRELWEREWRP